MSFWVLPGKRSPSQSESQSRKQGHKIEGSRDDEDAPLQLTTLAEAGALQPQRNDGPTLLWSPAAKLVSAATGIGSFYVRTATRLGGWGIAAGREVTIRSLEMSRVAAEAILLAAGRDVSSRRSGELGRAEAESMLERSISALHSTIASISFLTSSGFYIAQTSMDSLSTVSIQGLSTLNAVLGSTESSRAVAAIITLIRDELRRPGAHGNKVVAGYLDLLVGTIGFVLLQRWGRRKTELEFRDAGGEETIWDTVIDDKGFRADVVGTKRKDLVTATKNTTSTRLGESTGHNSLVLEKGLDLDLQSISLSTQDQTNLSDEEIRALIVSQLPVGTRATISSETLTMKTVTVEIHDGETAHIEPPPGLVVHSESLNYDGSVALGAPRQTIVFRSSLNRSSSTEITPVEGLRLTSMEDPAPDLIEGDGLVMTSPTSSRRSLTGHILGHRMSSDQSDWDKPLPSRPDLDRGAVANQKKSRKPARSPSPSDAWTTRSGHPRQPGDKPEGRDGFVKKALKTLSPKPPSNIQALTSPTMRRDSAPVSASTRQSLGSQPSHYAQKRVYPPVSTEQASLPTPHYMPTLATGPSNYFTMHERKRESSISQTDTFSLHSTESRPPSPTTFRTHVRAESGISKTKSQSEMAMLEPERPGSKDSRHHRRSKSFVPSLYSMSTKNDEESIILAPKTSMHKSIYEDHKMLIALATDGRVPGIFPNQHLVKTVRRFARFSSASYGANFLRVMGISSEQADMSKSTELMTIDVHHAHSSFSTHTGLPADTILLSSFFDPKGAMASTVSSRSAISPLIHFISLDHDSRAVVLTCRGTLGFEDVLADMTFDYDDLHWQGQAYKVHKGIHASARRLLRGLGQRVMSTIRDNLQQYPDYGLVLCGHSLGGAVAAILAILISEPCATKEDGTLTGPSAFVTAKAPKMITLDSTPSSPLISLPAGRPIHVYAYGPPACLSSALRLATRGLITTVVNHNDIVPSLSLGTLHDFRAVALHLKTDTSGALEILRKRVFDRLAEAVRSAFYVEKVSGPPPASNVAGDGPGEDTWAWTALSDLRAQMTSEKLVPPGECFVIETTRVFDRMGQDQASHGSVYGGVGGSDAADAETLPETRYFRSLGRPATRVQFKLIRDVERRFGELRFGRHMFGDHSPGRYEAGLGALDRGICEE